MSSPLSGNTISLTAVRRAIADYPKQLKAGLEELDRLRFTTIPEALQTRRKGNAAVSLSRAETISLVEWKLKHGTFRPRLLSLVSSNEESLIRDATLRAYRAYEEADRKTPTEALNILTVLKGIGPATASLLLSVYDPRTAPFFSDELFRWVTGADVSSTGKPQGWDKKIGYNKKEFKELWEGTRQIRKRLVEENEGEMITAVELEKAAYVIARWHAAGGPPQEDIKRDGKRSREVEVEKKEASDDDKPRRKSTRTK